MLNPVTQHVQEFHYQSLPPALAVGYAVSCGQTAGFSQTSTSGFSQLVNFEKTG
jgi:hypothetical protein